MANTTENNSELREEDIKVMVKGLIFEKLSEEEIKSISQSHTLLS